MKNKVIKETTVVNVKTDEFDEYIGRAVRNAKDPRCRVDSVYANPYVIGRNGLGRNAVLRLYESLWRCRLSTGVKRAKVWRERLESLCGKRLGCWCKPLPCHGDVLVKLLNE